MEGRNFFLGSEAGRNERCQRWTDGLKGAEMCTADTTRSGSICRWTITIARFVGRRSGWCAGGRESSEEGDCEALKEKVRGRDARRAAALRASLIISSESGPSRRGL